MNKKLLFISLCIGFVAGCFYSIKMYKYMKKKDLENIFAEMAAMRNREV